MAFFAALWTGLGTGSFLQRMFAGTPVALLSWIVFRILGELMRAGGDTSDDNVIVIALYPAVTWILSVACFLCLRGLPMTRWQIVSPLPTADTDHDQPQQPRAVTNIFMITCTWLTLFYLLRMCHQWHSLFNPLELSKTWDPIQSCANHAIRFVPFILLAPALTLTTWTERILYRKQWFPVILVLVIALACFAMLVEGFHYANPNGTWLVYGLSSIAIPLLLLGRSGYRIRRHQSPGELDAGQQVAPFSWQRPHVAALLAVLAVALAMVPTGTLRNVRRNLYLSHFDIHDNAIEVNEDGHITKLFFGMHTTNDTLQDQLSELTHLESLGIQSWRITDDGLRHLQQMPHLKYLDLAVCEYVTGSGLRYMHKSCQLKTMIASFCPFTDTAIKELKRHATLEHLWLDSTQITDNGLAHLVKLTNLQALHLDRTSITDAGLIHLKGLINLKDLKLYDTQVTDVGLAALKDLELATLGIPTAATTDLGLKNYLASLKPPSELYLDQWKITDAGLEHLKELTTLQNLVLRSTRITDAGLIHLNGLPNLKYLDLGGTQATGMGVAELQKALPDCEITH
jgi:Leucine-rich repeat (LRR) protein